MTTVSIQITGTDHTRKTRIAVLVSRLLEKYGATVSLQRADKELDEKLLMTDDQLGEKLGGVDIFISEMRTALHTKERK